MISSTFPLSRSARRMEEEEREKMKEGAAYTPYYLTTDRRYMPGYYGLLCLPVYVITIALGLLIKSFL